MNKNEFQTNMSQAIDMMDVGVSNDDIDFIVNMLYDEKQIWYFNDFYDFAHELSKEDGNVEYTLEQFDGLPELLDRDNEVAVRDWFADHKQCIKDVLAYASMDTKDLHQILFLDIETLVEWLHDHKQAYRDCCVYVKSRKRK